MNFDDLCKDNVEYQKLQKEHSKIYWEMAEIKNKEIDKWIKNNSKFYIGKFYKCKTVYFKILKYSESIYGDDYDRYYCLVLHTGQKGSDGRVISYDYIRLRQMNDFEEITREDFYSKLEQLCEKVKQR